MSGSRSDGTGLAGAVPAELAAVGACPPERLAIIVDFDGTLAPIVDDPAQAAPDAAAQAALRALHQAGVLVACVTGRPALQARELLGLPELEYFGLHGAEALAPGDAEPTVAQAFAADAERVHALVDEAAPDALEGLDVERKGPIIALHWRRAADPAAAEHRAERLAAQAREAGLRVGAGRAVLEIRPGLEVTKGDAVRALVAAAPARTALLAAGDDLTDLTAFAAARELLAAARVEVASCIAVAGADAPAVMAREADLVVPAPQAFGAVLEALARRAGAPR